MSDEDLRAFGEECVAEAAPAIIAEAVAEKTVEIAGLMAAQAVLERQRDDAREALGDERDARKGAEGWARLLEGLASILVAVSFIFGWWRFGT